MWDNVESRKASFVVTQTRGPLFDFAITSLIGISSDKGYILRLGGAFFFQHWQIWGGGMF